MNQFVSTYISGGYASGSSTICLTEEWANVSATYRKDPGNLGSKGLLSTTKERVKEKLSFLSPYHESIHSLVIVGSTACGTQTTNSDIDVVIITTKKGHEKVCEGVFGSEIEEFLNSNEKLNFEYTVLSSEQVTELFQISSPFAFSIRHGVVIEDDGFVHLLRNKSFPTLPQEKYYISCLYEKIATPYFGLLKKFQAEARSKGCDLSCPGKSNGCKGLPSATLFAKLVMHMLYVTLPARGMMPLTKRDVIAYAKIAYGARGENVARNAVLILQEKRSSFCFDEFNILKNFAIQQYIEILNITGLSRKVRDIISDAAKITRKDFPAISNPSMKNCVI